MVENDTGGIDRSELQRIADEINRQMVGTTTIPKKQLADWRDTLRELHPDDDRQATDDDQVNEIVSMIRETWGDQDDFEDGGWNYAAFVIREDLREMESEGWRSQTCVREMTDVVINAARALDELGIHAPLDEMVRYRLQGHENKGIDNIVGDYQRRFETRL